MRHQRHVAQPLLLRCCSGGCEHDGRADIPGYHIKHRIRLQHSTISKPPQLPVTQCPHQQQCMCKAALKASVLK